MIEKDDFVALADLRKPLSESRLALIAYMPRATPFSAAAIRSAISFPPRAVGVPAGGLDHSSVKYPHDDTGVDINASFRSSVAGTRARLHTRSQKRWHKKNELMSRC